MNRYATTKIIKDKYGVRKASTTIIPSPPVSNLDTYIQITSPERLDRLAFKFYGDSTIWWVIASANNLGNGSLFVNENTTIRIPNKAGIQDLISKVNKER